MSCKGSWAFSGDLEPVTITEHPLDARSLAVACPIPLVDPVIKAAFLAKNMFIY